MRYLIKLFGRADGPILADHEARWLKSFDPDAADGRGSTEQTDDPAEALGFSTLHEAYKFWKQESKVRPLRPDGRPNRPLTAFHIQITAVNDGE